MKRHTLRSLFAAILRPFADAWRDEFVPRPAPAVEPGTAPQAACLPASQAPRLPGPAPIKLPPVLAVKPGQSWREAMAQRLAAEPPGLRPKLPAKRAKPTRKAKPTAKAKGRGKSRKNPIA